MKRPPMTLYRNALMIFLENRLCKYHVLRVHGAPKTYFCVYIKLMILCVILVQLSGSSCNSQTIVTYLDNIVHNYRTIFVYIFNWWTCTLLSEDLSVSLQLMNLYAIIVRFSQRTCTVTPYWRIISILMDCKQKKCWQSLGSWSVKNDQER